MSRPFPGRRTASRAREHLVDLERSEQIYLVIREDNDLVTIEIPGGASRAREHLVDLERSEQIYLVIREDKPAKITKKCTNRVTTKIHSGKSGLAST